MFLPHGVNNMNYSDEYELVDNIVELFMENLGFCDFVRSYSWEGLVVGQPFLLYS